MSYNYGYQQQQPSGFYQPQQHSQQPQQHSQQYAQPHQYNQFSNNVDFNSVQGSMSGDLSGGSSTLGDRQLSKGIFAAFSTSGYPGEPPLLEELGINFQHIVTKTKLVLSPLGSYNLAPEIISDADLAGPVLFCLLFGTFLLLAGKIHFGYIYGVALFGTGALHMFLNLMTDQPAIEFVRTASVIGYCLLPLVPLSLLGVFVSLENMTGYILAMIAVLWCTWSASGFFVKVLQLANVRALIAYPLGLFYSVFAVIAVFVEKADL